MNRRGTTPECFKALAALIQKKPNYFELRRAIAAFTQTRDGAVYLWIKHQQLPTGETLVRLRFYLDLLGFDVEEVRRLNPHVRDVARIYAHGITSLEETAHALGFHAVNPQSNRSHILKVFRGTRGITPQREKDFAAFAELYADELANAIKQVPRMTVGFQEKPRDEGVKPIQAQVVVHMKDPPSEDMRSALVDALAASVRSIIPLARAVSSEHFTPQDRARVRELVGHNGVMNAANLLFRICGERSREAHQQSATSKKG